MSTCNGKSVKQPSTLQVTGLTSPCSQFTDSDVLRFKTSEITTTLGREGKVHKKTSFTSLLLSQKKLAIHKDTSALQSKNWIYKHVYRLSGRPKLESLSTKSISVGLPTSIQENVIFCHS